ncbi:hypothetical protein [Prescottella agglutinans]|uniref:Uncharacterized protein n=1 Tax=Prescottella agglutinans TaxID=1644129 RepID=A0ABT6MKS9_9NOCA|nr:hypothetical protein [Prescottella agglutinans]MDH6284830.1 hypothetical protein [Prescottella agglutinans]
MSATQFVYLDTRLPVCEVAATVGAVVGAELKSNSKAGEFDALLPSSQLSLYLDTEGDIDGYVLTVDRHPQGLDGVTRWLGRSTIGYLLRRHGNSRSTWQTGLWSGRQSTDEAATRASRAEPLSRRAFDRHWNGRQDRVQVFECCP